MKGHLLVWGFFSFYLSGEIRAFDRKGHVAKLCLVGISRVDDYWHHWEDVFAGALTGLVVAAFCYLNFFPPYHVDASRKKLLLQGKAASSTGDRNPNNTFNTGISLSDDSRSAVEDIESGHVLQMALKYPDTICLLVVYIRNNSLSSLQ